MKIKKVRDPEYPSTVIVRPRKNEEEHKDREYWTGSGWSRDIGEARRYLRARAERKSKNKKHSFVVTVGFMH